MKERPRKLLHAVPFQPFIIPMADGRRYRVNRPDFALASPSNQSRVVIEEADGRIHTLSALLMTSVEELISTASAH